MINYAFVILENIYTFILSLFAAYYACRWLILNNSWKKLFFIEPYMYIQTIVIYFQFILQIIYVFLTIFLYLLKCPQSLIL